MLEQQAGSFISDVVKRTPPNSNFKYQKSAGNKALKRDVYKVMAPTCRQIKVNPKQVHQRFRGHGGSNGSVLVRFGDRSLRIRMANRVPYVGKIDGMDRRMQTALNNRARTMWKQVEN